MLLLRLSKWGTGFRCAAVRHQFGRKQWWLCSHQSGTSDDSTYQPVLVLFGMGGKSSWRKTQVGGRDQLIFFGWKTPCMYSNLKFGHSEEDLVDLFLQFGCSNCDFILLVHAFEGETTMINMFLSDHWIHSLATTKETNIGTVGVPLTHTNFLPRMPVTTRKIGLGIFMLTSFTIQPLTFSWTTWNIKSCTSWGW